jgi:hypothetical protein
MALLFEITQSLRSPTRSLGRLSARMSYSLPFGLRPDEQTLDTPAEVEESSGHSRANPLEDEEPGARINISVGLTFKSEAECDK